MFESLVLSAVLALQADKDRAQPTWEAPARSAARQVSADTGSAWTTTRQTDDMTGAELVWIAASGPDSWAGPDGSTHTAGLAVTCNPAGPTWPLWLVMTGRPLMPVSRSLGGYDSFTMLVRADDEPAFTHPLFDTQPGIYDQAYGVGFKKLARALVDRESVKFRWTEYDGTTRTVTVRIAGLREALRELHSQPCGKRIRKALK